MNRVLSELAAWRERDEEFALATLVAVHGSAPMRAGARMLVSRGGRMAGSVSGGCVETDVVRVAGEVLAQGRPRVVTYSLSTEPDLQVGLGCGSIEVLVERFEDGPSWKAVRAALAERRPVALAVGLATEAVCGRSLAVVDGEPPTGTIDPSIDGIVVAEARSMLADGGTKTLTVKRAAGEASIFVQAFAAPPRLFIVGATDIGTYLCRLAKVVGFDVTVIDPRRPFATLERFPEADHLVLEWPHEFLASCALDGSSFVVALTHDAKFDVPTLAVALRSGVGYIGALGSVRTHARRKAKLVTQGFTTAELDRIHAPVGLDLGARTPEEIALAITAEIVAARYGHDGGTLNAKRAALHGHSHGADARTKV